MTAFIAVNMEACPGSGDEVIAMLTEMLDGTAAFGGLIQITLHQDVQDPDRILIMETWLSRERYQEYAEWRLSDDQFRDLLGKLKRPPKVHFLAIRLTFPRN